MHESTYQCNQGMLCPGYFQRRGWEDVKHAKPLCIYANWLHFSIWTPTLLKWTCLPVPSLCMPTFFFFVFKNKTQKEKMRTERCHFSWRAARLLTFLCTCLVSCGINREKGGWGVWLLLRMSNLDSRWFCDVIPCVLVTQQNTLWWVLQPGSRVNRIAMQISDCKAYAKEVSMSQIHLGLTAVSVGVSCTAMTVFLQNKSEISTKKNCGFVCIEWYEEHQQ